jgi:hypothetical protein
MTDPIRLMTYSAESLQRDYIRALQRERTINGPAKSTVDAFFWLIKQNDQARLDAWLDRHHPDEVKQLMDMLFDKK